MGAARAVTPKTARVIGYDLQGRDDGTAVLLYREDDTPSGSTGGRVELVTVELGGVSDPKPIAEEGLGTGVPLLYGDWVVIHSLAGPVRVGLLGPKGDLVSDLAPETALRLGEILGGNNERFLVGTPAGRAMKLSVVQCARQ
ncbi:MAG: hypothetical protein IPK82_04435 [Polyangiaceae bacterium]|nr:hypothetical protein [Polyangiaceae bacterium]